MLVQGGAGEIGTSKRGKGEREVQADGDGAVGMRMIEWGMGGRMGMNEHERTVAGRTTRSEGSKENGKIAT